MPGTTWRLVAVLLSRGCVMAVDTGENHESSDHCTRIAANSASVASMRRHCGVWFGRVCSSVRPSKPDCQRAFGTLQYFDHTASRSSGTAAEGASKFSATAGRLAGSKDSGGAATATLLIGSTTLDVATRPASTLMKHEPILSFYFSNARTPISPAVSARS